MKRLPNRLLLFSSLALLLLLSLAGCPFPGDTEFQPQLVLHCLLRTGTSPVRAKVNHNYKIDQPFDSVFADARIVITSRAGQWSFNHIAGDSYTTTVPVPVQSGDTYQIVVTHPDYDTIRATTVVPGPFTITYPRPGDTVSINDSMVWTRSQGANGYYMAFREPSARDTFYWDILIPNDSFGEFYDPHFVRIPAMFFLYTMMPPPDSPPRACTLRLWALDTNYYYWIDEGRIAGDGESLRSRSRIFGGLGVFGSAVAEELPIFVRSDTFIPRPQHSHPGEGCRR